VPPPALQPNVEMVETRAAPIQTIGVPQRAEVFELACFTAGRDDARQLRPPDLSPPLAGGQRACGVSQRGRVILVRSRSVSDVGRRARIDANAALLDRSARRPVCFVAVVGLTPSQKLPHIATKRGESLHGPATALLCGLKRTGTAEPVRER
jgi:hypothetical protein